MMSTIQNQKSRRQTNRAILLAALVVLQAVTLAYFLQEEILSIVPQAVKLIIFYIAPALLVIALITFLITKTKAEKDVDDLSDYEFPRDMSFWFGIICTVVVFVFSLHYFLENKQFKEVQAQEKAERQKKYVDNIVSFPNSTREILYIMIGKDQLVDGITSIQYVQSKTDFSYIMGEDTLSGKVPSLILYYGNENGMFMHDGKEVLTKGKVLAYYETGDFAENDTLVPWEKDSLYYWNKQFPLTIIEKGTNWQLEVTSPEALLWDETDSIVYLLPPIPDKYVRRFSIQKDGSKKYLGDVLVSKDGGIWKKQRETKK